ncbi:hypothetical protein RAD10_03120 [Bradyrhizobium sp. 23AC]
MDEAFELCPDLKAKELCLVVRRYHHGKFTRAYHQHIPQHRISDEALSYLLPALVMKFENNEPLTIVRSFLNKRGKDPAAFTFRWEVAYPEPGVLRKYCGTDTCAWVDQIISRSKFRIKAKESKSR